MRALILITLVFCISCSQKESLSGSGAGSDGGGSSSSGSMNSESAAMYRATNRERVAQGLPALGVLGVCVRMAQDHAVDMVERRYFSHDSPTEPYQQRAGRYGLAGGYYGENIASGSGQVERTLEAWMNSPGHRANILNVNFVSMGVGYHEGRWVQCFSSYPGDIK